MSAPSSGVYSFDARNQEILGTAYSNAGWSSIFIHYKVGCSEFHLDESKNWLGKGTETQYPYLEDKNEDIGDCYKVVLGSSRGETGVYVQEKKDGPVKRVRYKPGIHFVGKVAHLVVHTVTEQNAETGVTFWRGGQLQEFNKDEASQTLSNPSAAPSSTRH